MPPQVIHVKNASKVANALANEKCQKILEYLGKHADATETKLSKELKIPLSTVHYNMKVLTEAKLVIGNEYTYSPKGKEVTHYRMNKNPIVIVQEDGQLDLLKAVVPAAIIAAAVGIAWSFLERSTEGSLQQTALDTGAPAAAKMMAATAPQAAQMAAWTPEDMLPYFFGGIIIMLFVTFLLAMVLRWWNQRQS